MLPAEPSFVEIGKMGEGTLQVCLVALAAGTLPRTDYLTIGNWYNHDYL
jgi:hypothetical protein